MTSAPPPLSRDLAVSLSEGAVAKGELPDLSQRQAPEIASPIASTSTDVKPSVPVTSIPDAKSKADSGDLLAKPAPQ